MHHELTASRLFNLVSSACGIFSLVMDSDQVLIPTAIVDSTDFFISIQNRFINVNFRHAWSCCIVPIHGFKLWATLNWFDLTALIIVLRYCSVDLFRIVKRFQLKLFCLEIWCLMLLLLLLLQFLALMHVFFQDDLQYVWSLVHFFEELLIDLRCWWLLTPRRLNFCVVLYVELCLIDWILMSYFHFGL